MKSWSEFHDNPFRLVVGLLIMFAVFMGVFALILPVGPPVRTVGYVERLWTSFGETGGSVTARIRLADGSLRDLNIEGRERCSVGDRLDVLTSPTMIGRISRADFKGCVYQPRLQPLPPNR